MILFEIGCDTPYSDGSKLALAHGNLWKFIESKNTVPPVMDLLSIKINLKYHLFALTKEKIWQWNDHSTAWEFAQTSKLQPLIRESRQV